MRTKISSCLLTVLVFVLFLTGNCRKSEQNNYGEIFLAEGSLPVWSPDGSKIAYIGNSGFLYSMTSDGKNQQRLASDIHSRPAWSPSGNNIIYTDSNFDIFRINSDGSNKVNLTNSTMASHVPAWSKDGTKIAFIGSGNLTSDLYLMYNDGSSMHKVTNLTNVSVYETPVWSSNGNTIMFSSDINNTDGDIYFINTNGNNQNRLVINGILEEEAQLSADGSTIFFTGVSSNKADIYKVNSDGSGLTNLTGSIGVNHNLRLSPDGSRIAFTSYLNGEDCLYVMATDGTNFQKTSSPGAIGTPDFSPDGSQIVFCELRSALYGIYLIQVPK